MFSNKSIDKDDFINISGVKISRAHLKGPKDQPSLFSRPKKLGEVIRECCLCGSTRDVTFEPNPFAQEIEGDNTSYWQCQKCLEETAIDI